MYSTGFYTEKNISSTAFLKSHTFASPAINYPVEDPCLHLPDTFMLTNKLYITCTVLNFAGFFIQSLDR